MRFRIVIFTEFSVCIGPGGVEIPQRQVSIPWFAKPLQGPLEGEFRLTIRIDRPLGVSSWIGTLRGCRTSRMLTKRSCAGRRHSSSPSGD